ncbi:MAG: ABC transporter permease [Flavobacteriaceae bacterium]
MPKEEKWLIEITPKTRLLDLNLKEVWKYRDLLFLFVKRDVITKYKQTILGPLWYLIQPLFTSVIFTLIFNNFAGISTGEVPFFLFNLGGITCWNYFKDCLTETSDTFKKNEAIFGKVYFPRVIMPMSTIFSNLLKFGIQLFIFICFYIYYAVFEGMDVNIGWELLYLPILIISMGVIGLGLGMMISSMVTKYRDLTFLVAFGVQLLMYLSGVMYSVTELQKKLVEYPEVVSFVKHNPITTVIESFRKIVFEGKAIELVEIAYIVCISIVIFLLGLILFNRTEKSFIDNI